MWSKTEAAVRFLEAGVSIKLKCQNVCASASYGANVAQLCHDASYYRIFFTKSEHLHTSYLQNLARARRGIERLRCVTRICMRNHPGGPIYRHTRLLIANQQLDEARESKLGYIEQTSPIMGTNIFVGNSHLFLN